MFRYIIRRMCRDAFIEGIHSFLITGIRDVYAGRPVSPVPTGLSIGDVMTEAARHGVASLVAAEGGGGRYRAMVNHVTALSVLAGITDALDKAEIPYAVLKGSYLYETLYHDELARFYSDIDLLVPARLRERALGCLMRQGYRVALGGLGGWLARRMHFHLALESESKPMVELHWALVDGMNLYRIDEASVFMRMTEWRGGGRSFKALSLENEFLYLCLHVAKHGVWNEQGLQRGYAPEWFCDVGSGNRLLWFLDLALFLRAHEGGVDWGGVAETARRWNVVDDVVTGLGITDLLLPESLAGNILSRIKPKGYAGTRAGGLHHAIGHRGYGMTYMMTAVGGVQIRPVRFLVALRVLLPPPKRLLGYYGVRSRVWLPFLYAWHPFRTLQRVLSGR